VIRAYRIYSDTLVLEVIKITVPRFTHAADTPLNYDVPDYLNVYVAAVRHI